MEAVYEEEFNADLSELADLRYAICQRFSSIHCPKPVIKDFKLAATEIFSNLIIHVRPAPQMIRVALGKESDQYFMELKDNGRPIHNLDHIFAESKNQLHDEEIRCCGIGLYLVCQIFPDIDYTPASSDQGFNVTRLIHPSK